MKFTKFQFVLGITVTLIFISACGGANSSSTDQEPNLGLGSTSSSEFTAISGRVADGYLSGATVCVDVNENARCDADEPQSVSVAGGIYSLDIPDTQSSKPILAIVPATAIDEDTGEEIGKELQFSTPGEKPSFVSPITTLVHQELKDNPSLNPADAEATVLETLGLPDEKEASLFTDYVASSGTGDEELREKFHYLHQTARVVATMMGDIQENVEAVAIENGIDVSNDEQTQSAIRQLVHDEVRALLPEISAAVADQISNVREEEYATGSIDSTNQAIDIASIIGNLTVKEVTSEVVDVIDAIKTENPIVKASMKAILTKGFYLLDVDCGVDDEYGTEDGIEEEIQQSGALILHDDGTPGRIDIPEYCEATYSYLTVTGADDTLQEERYIYDTENAQWVMDLPVSDNDEKPQMMVLSEGEWIEVSEDGGMDSVEFSNDGGAIFSSELGGLEVYAMERVLDNTSVQHHLKGRRAESDIIELVPDDLVFSTESSEYKLHIKRDSELTVLFNWHAEENEEADNPCALYNGNCNVVGTSTNDGFAHYTYLTEIQQASVNGLLINEIAFDNKLDTGIDIKLEADVDSAGAEPNSGSVSWMLSTRTWPQDENEKDDPTELLCIEVDPSYIKHNLDYDWKENIDHDGKGDEQKCTYLIEKISPAGDENTQDSTKIIARSRWSTVVKNGVAMIQVTVPVSVRHRIDQDEIASMLLIEEGGFVRRGARFSDQSVDDEVAYNNASFSMLRPIIEKIITD